MTVGFKFIVASCLVGGLCSLYSGLENKKTPLLVIGLYLLFRSMIAFIADPEVEMLIHLKCSKETPSKSYL